ncbi:glutamine cyclotransferase [Maribacter vaceletii]|uniref:Glutamine cyclotransferase n=1 Tax=Maribacter vaceletii TaxID=1206816 RepID=A0A495E8W0_9FLAO|nr:glutaminyl-peptide cyclotransferase [Maribacter vaceletii]RKR13358.1 glutamine cyclotransferase [Maribacter vaceletii]
MNIIKLFIFSLTILLCINCGGSNPAASSLFEIGLEENKKEFTPNQKVAVSIINKKEKDINKVVYFLDNTPLKIIDDKLEIKTITLGNKTITAKITYEDTTVEIHKKIKVLSPTAPEIYTYEIINEYPHDIEAYTQGLEFYKDTLYESTGRRGFSSLRKVDYKTGNILKKIDLDKTYFGEGITILNDKIYQLTWQNKTGFIYDVNSLKKTGSFQYGESKEGWGLCNDGTKIFKSDGTEKIWFLNATTLIEEDHIETVTNKSIFNKANELEYVNGKLYANVYQKPSIMIIDATSGSIEGVINFSGLKNKVTKHDTIDVLNGIAYHPTRETFFVTGKNWDKLFEVKILKK